MVRHIRRESGRFEVSECDFLNFYYELIYKDACYAYAHLQLALAEQFVYCHVYIHRFSPELAKEIKRDWADVQDNMRVFDIKKVVGTKVDGIDVWSRFVKILGFEDIGPSIINNEPCMMAVMEL